jgi:hypothetical protein
LGRVTRLRDEGANGARLRKRRLRWLVRTRALRSLGIKKESKGTVNLGSFRRLLGDWMVMNRDRLLPTGCDARDTVLNKDIEYVSVLVNSVPNIRSQVCSYAESRKEIGIRNRVPRTG